MSQIRMGRRERGARKRHRRAGVADAGTGWVTLRLGSKKMRSHICTVFRSMVDDAEPSTVKRALENPR